MATSVDYIEFVCGQVSGTGAVRYKKMFGEYMVYVNDKPILLVCDNTVFVKILPCLDTLMASAERGKPYDSAKEHYILDIEDAELSSAVVAALEEVTDVPKPREKKKRGGDNA
jgi:TfoX/Sxy family transcriptional regulator of competence genes